MQRKYSWPVLLLCLVAAQAFGQARNTYPCATPRQHADSEARIAAITRGFDSQRIGSDYASADNQRLQALVTIRRCQTSSPSGMRCSRELEQYTIADQQYRYAAQNMDAYNTAAATQARARAAELPPCR
ncbi:hypothetical protein C7402_12961 [Paraburkholderia unamae]|uniref:UrcA family protein n=2 Tax=Paraburkholderia unamae TaxID=219649 RepID=A0ABX5K9L1_9BURK|nr:hypothetical protein C7402_12961 [Paraburkholderia unamae]CAG9274966.1 exported hypothetical protein [Paraburkholderia unamae]